MKILSCFIEVEVKEPVGGFHDISDDEKLAKIDNSGKFACSIYSLRNI
jgi:hypothetical protein